MKEQLFPDENRPEQKSLEFEVAFAQAPNLRGSELQDRTLQMKEVGLFAVCDGAGGHADAAKAAQEALDDIKKYARNWENPQRPNKAELQAESLLKGANRAVMKNTSDGRTTITLARIWQSPLGIIATISSLGDSRAYSFTNGNLSCLTLDEGAMTDYILSKGGSREKAIDAQKRLGNVKGRDEIEDDDVEIMIGSNPRTKNLVNNWLGKETSITANRTRHYQMQKGDTILLCTDGITNNITEKEMAEILISAQNVDKATQSILAEASKNRADQNRPLRNDDDMSIVLIRVKT